MDRAALDAALELGMPCGGWCPRGRRAADGVIPMRYPLRETRSSDYDERTRCNVRDSDATLVLHLGGLSGGTLLTVQFATQLAKPLLCVNLAQAWEFGWALQWLQCQGVRSLNVAGPREQEQPGMYRLAKGWIHGLYTTMGLGR